MTIKEIPLPLRGKYIGLAGEYRVISELLLRHYNVFASRLDNGIDLVLENGMKIQVKSSHLINNKTNNSRYYHFIWQGYYSLANGTRKPTIYNDECDIFIFWCINHDVFYIIPFKDLGGRKGVDLFPKSIGASPNRKTRFARNRSMWNKYIDRWDLLLEH